MMGRAGVWPNDLQEYDRFEARMNQLNVRYGPVFSISHRRTENSQPPNCKLFSCFSILKTTNGIGKWISDCRGLMYNLYKINELIICSIDSENAAFQNRPNSWLFCLLIKLSLRNFSCGKQVSVWQLHHRICMEINLRTRRIQLTITMLAKHRHCLLDNYLPHYV